MRIIFFGLGSIGQRHAKILTDTFNGELFAYRTHKGYQMLPHGFRRIKELNNWNDVKRTNADIAFITNPTFMHIETALRCARLNMNLFIEKPIDCSDKNLDVLIAEIKKRKLISYIAYNLRFHSGIIYLKDYLKNKEIYHVNVYNSSLLSCWRRKQNHLESYSASLKKGGGVILELSHEFDYINYLFGEIMNISGNFDKVSELTRDAEDFADVFIKTRKTNVNLHLNFLSLHTERSLKIDCKDEFIFMNLIASEMKIIRGNKIKITKFNDLIKDTYRKQLDYFFNNIHNPQIMNNLPEASDLFRKLIAFMRNEEKR